jgi:hemoglobin/transferrin/lactoferrin receptor protein
LNPQDYDDRSFLGKLLFQPAEGHRLRLTLDALQSTTETDVLSARATTTQGPSRITVDGQSGDDESDRQRLAFDYRIDSPNAVFDGASLLAYRQDSETVQDTVERRTTTAASGIATRVERERRFTFDQDVLGVELLFHKRFELAGAEHRLVWGGESSRTDTAQQRDGLQRNLATGAVSPVVSPDTFPVRDFPISETREQALFLQNRLRFADGRFELQPGVRWDRVALDPKPDTIFMTDNPGVVPISTRHTEVSPKLAAIWRLDAAWSLHAQWAEGFRAPPYSDVNVGFTNLQFGYTAIPNPDLKPETSRGIELGVRWRFDAGYLAFSAYRNRYRDFIESLVSLGPDPTSGLLVFQSQNLTDVRIEGAELRGAVGLGALHEGLDGWRIDAALASARGDDLSADRPLDSIDPARAVLGLGYTTRDGAWDMELVSTAVQGKRRLADAAAFRAPGHLLLDLLVQWRPRERLTVSSGVFNLADRTVWEWADVRGRPATDPVIDRYTGPGRHAGVTVAYEF